MLQQIDGSALFWKQRLWWERMKDPPLMEPRWWSSWVLQQPHNWNDKKTATNDFPPFFPLTNGPIQIRMPIFWTAITWFNNFTISLGLFSLKYFLGWAFCTMCTSKYYSHSFGALLKIIKHHAILCKGEILTDLGVCEQHSQSPSTHNSDNSLTFWRGVVFPLLHSDSQYEIQRSNWQLLLLLSVSGNLTDAPVPLPIEGGRGFPPQKQQVGLCSSTFP